MDLLATAGFQWDSAVIEGFRIGPGEINTSLEQATIRFDSMQIPVSQGKLLLAPQISFRTASPISEPPRDALCVVTSSSASRYAP